MRAVVVREFGGPDVLVTVDVPVPVPGPGDVLVKVAAAAVNFADVMVRVGGMVRYGSAIPRDQFGVGVDIAGTVSSVGDGVLTVAVGDRVIGLQERLDLPLGGYADYVLLEDWAVAPVPAGKTMAEAATLPLNVTTADQALDALDLVSGQWLLVTGAAGAVGGLATELAVLRGLRVIAQAGSADEDVVRGFGAEAFVPRGSHLADAVRSHVPGGAHGALDTTDQGVAASDAVRHGGAYLSLLNAAPQPRRGIRMINHAYHTDGKRLAELSALAGAGHLSLRVAGTFPLTEATRAHEVLANGGVRGRLVLLP